MKRKTEVSELIFRIVAYVFLIIFAAMCIYPLIYALAAAFSDKTSMDAGSVIILPMVGNKVGATIEAFKVAFMESQFWVNYANTLFMAFVGTIWCLFYTVLGAYALSKKRLMGRHGFNFFLVFTMWFSAGVVATALNYTHTSDIFASFVGKTAQEIDLKWVVIIAMGMNATNLILLRNAFEGVPSEIEEAARIDGATELQILTKVYIPMSKATIATVALFFGISRWNGYFWAYKVLQDDPAYSWPVQVYIRDYINRFTTLTGEPLSDADADRVNALEYSTTAVVYAMVVLAVVPILVIYPFIQKYFAKGVNMGGVKE